MKSRYCYCPMTARKIGRRSSWLAKIRRRRMEKRNAPDMFPIVGYNAPIYPGK